MPLTLSAQRAETGSRSSRVLLLSGDNKSTLRTRQPKSPTPNKVRLRRARTDIRQALLESALVEFGAKGFDGASTRAIASRVQAHQPQINYHFETKTALWMAAVDHLFGLLREAFDGVIPTTFTGVEVAALAAAFADGIRRFVAFAAEHPELNQIMVHEGTAESDRLKWMTETHVKPFFDGIRPAWRGLCETGVAWAGLKEGSSSVLSGG